MEINSNEVSIKPVSENELPPEFKKFDKPFGLEQHQLNSIAILLPHVGAAYYFLYLLPFGHVPASTLIFVTIYGYFGGLGITIGSHRYWTHRSFKAKLPLQILLMIMHTSSGQLPIFKWCKDHRVHHQYTDTNADPHNASRGFWFSHITWMLQPKHPEVEEKLKNVDISDLAKDPVVRFQSKYYWELILVLFLVVPIAVCHVFFPTMTFWQIASLSTARFIGVLHSTFLVNSIAHMWGDKPYDKDISSTENKLVSVLTGGEGWHNYHHVFPWDYKAAELGYHYSMSTAVIDFFSWIGWAYDLKTVSHKLLVDRVNRTGDGSHDLHADIKTTEIKETSASDISSRTCWGWGDKQLKKQDIDITETIYPEKSL